MTILFRPQCLDQHFFTHPFFLERPTGLISYLYLGKVLSPWQKMLGLFSHWLKPCSETVHRKEIFSHCETSNIGCTLVSNKIVHHSDCSWSIGCRRCSNIFIFDINIWLQYIAQRQPQDETRNIDVLGFGASYIKRFDGIYLHFDAWRILRVEAPHTSSTSATWLAAGSTPRAGRFPGI